MNVFDIIGPVMIGPSSSHTAGAVRLGRVAWKILGEEPVKAEIELSGSFAQTYKGHGTDKALIAGIMGMHSYDENIKCSLEIAKKQGLVYGFKKANIPDSHPNTARITLYGKDGATAVVEGASIGGGNILVAKVNGMDVTFTGQYNTILVRHYDRPGTIAAVTNFMAYSDVNIGNFRLSRPKKGGEAIMTIEIDGNPPENLMEQLKLLPHVIGVILLRAM
ncbi:L-serine ammonia-lyase, iron-sulfur-dependent subunit beta [Clostridium sp. AM58-1XD]|uniref:L-serine ammonia-lyase, iron-sulfur-dependent subunit beta n=1 Tax=Clostridium sp. AM58-1XD TaxID=2292307 RepID=UPI000E51FAED|nr:L-serine ammonia-lyase, iron-sulfur-dependent subunit beta [Clostridium sp. AM58-1XD]RGY99298.1 L-serine ammonia-lyase, iron-sulfur-dependent, subunit beta [Clostridium sp. AM58-1XD]